MFFNESVAGIIYPDLFQVVHREINPNHVYGDPFPISNPHIPTHTEDGIPIRKLYVTNLPPKTTRTELFGVFTQYGYVRSCWLRMGEKGPNKTLSATYGFVTFSNPSDAFRALQAPGHEKMLCGRVLRISPADSWHQPVEDSTGRVIWNNNSHYRNKRTEAINDDVVDCNVLFQTDKAESTDAYSEPNSNEEESEGCYNPLQILNRDCLSHILSFVPLLDLIRSERVNKSWQNMLNEYYHGIRTYKTSWWHHSAVAMTTAVLRQLLQRLGSLTRLHIDHHWSALNDRTAHTIGKFCPMLEELKVLSVNTQNWNPLFYGCKQLKYVSFYSCNKLTDSNLVHLIKNDSCIEYLTLANNSNVTGLFLTGVTPPHLNTLIFFNCFSLQGTVLCAAADTLTDLKVLKLDACPSTLWKAIPEILKKLPKLEELSLTCYTSLEGMFAPITSDNLCEALASMNKLKIVNFNKNIYVTNSVIKQLAKSCPNLESLNVAACNTRNPYTHFGYAAGVSDDAVAAVCRACVNLRHLDLSYLAGLTDAGVVATAQCQSLVALTVRGSCNLTAQSFITCLRACRFLEELDVCGCDNVSEALVEEALNEVQVHSRNLLLRIGGTLANKIYNTNEACHEVEVTSGNRLRLSIDDLCTRSLRPDFVDDIFDEGSDFSLDLDEMHDSDDDLYDDDDEYDLEEYEHVFPENLELLPQIELDIFHEFFAM